jgi:spore coat protein CotH
MGRRAGVWAAAVWLSACGGQDVCRPGLDGSRFLEEGDRYEVGVRCATGAGPGRIEPVTLPEGAVWDEATSRLRWQPDLDRAGVYPLELALPDFGERLRVELGVADRWADPANVPVVPAAYQEETGLPVLHVRTGAPLDHDIYVPADITYRGKTWAGEAKYRGRTSYKYPKRSLTLSFPADDRFVDDERGFHGVKKLAVITTFDDRSNLRGRLAFELWRRLDPAHVPIATFPAVLYLDGVYQGLYLVAEKVNDGLFERAGLPHGANLFQALDQDANFSLLDANGVPKTTLHQGYEKTEGAPPDGEPGAYADLDELIEFVAQGPDAAFDGEIGERVRLGDYFDWWVLVMAAGAGDTDEKNTFHFHAPGGGPWRLVPWDFNWSFGQQWRTQREPPDLSRLSTHNRLFKRFLDSPAHGPALRARLRAALRGPIGPDRTLAFFDAEREAITPGALRDQARWGAAHEAYFGEKTGRTDFLDFDGEADYVRDWIVRRWEYLLGRF